MARSTYIDTTSMMSASPASVCTVIWLHLLICRYLFLPLCLYHLYSLTQTKKLKTRYAFVKSISDLLPAFSASSSSSCYTLLCLILFSHNDYTTITVKTIQKKKSSLPLYFSFFLRHFLEGLGRRRRWGELLNPLKKGSIHLRRGLCACGNVCERVSDERERKWGKTHTQTYIPSWGQCPASSPTYLALG